MKIIFVGSQYHLSLERPGGIENVVFRLTEFLSERGHNVLLYIITKHNDKKYRRYFAPEVSLRAGTKSQIRGMILRSDFDTIVFLGTFFESPLFLLLYLFKKQKDKFKSIKMFFTFPPFKTNNFLQKVKMDLCIDTAITFSSRLSEELRKKWHGQVLTLMPPVAQHYFRLNRIRHSKPCIGYVGRLSKDKGIFLLKPIFEAFGAEEFKFMIFGYYVSEDDSISFNKIFNSIKVPVETNVFDPINQFRIHPPLEEIDYLVLPYQCLSNKSLDSPLLILEGLVAGCRVISSRLGSIHSIHTNLIVVDNYRDPEGFISAIEKQLQFPYDRPECKDFGLTYLGRHFELGIR